MEPSLTKYEQLVNKVQLLDANLSYAHIYHKNGVESTVSLRDLAPYGEGAVSETVNVDIPILVEESIVNGETPLECEKPDGNTPADSEAGTDASFVRRSGTARKPRQIFDF